MRISPAIVQFFYDCIGMHATYLLYYLGLKAEKIAASCTLEDV